MTWFSGQMRSWLTTGCLLTLPCGVCAQQFQIPVAVAPRAEQPSVRDWSKQLIETMNSCWMEGKASERDKKLNALAEQTPAHLAYVTRILQQHDGAQATILVGAMKETFSVLRRVGWQPADEVHIQRVVASWSVMAPQLVRTIRLPDLSATQRRVLEQALIDLASLSRDEKLGSPVARQTWQSLVGPLGELSRHQKTSVRLVALSVLEALGSDARSANAQVQQCLADTDCFVRWSAVRTLEAIGMDEAGLKAVAKLQKDEDAQVRQAAIKLLAAGVARPTTPTEVMATVTPKPLETKPIPLPTPVMTVPREAVPVIVTPPVPLPTPVTVSRKDDKSTVLTKAPEAIAVKPPSKPVEVQLPSLPPLDLPVKTEAVVAKPTAPTAPASLPVSLPAMPMQQVPASKPMQEPVPLFGPPTSSDVGKPAPERIQPIAATEPVKAAVSIQPVTLWLPRLKTGTVQQQIQAVQQLGKLGAGAADAVPALAELLIKGDVMVRREIPATLSQIGAPARMATAVLERCLQDRDTDVKVAAARALLELSDK